MLDLVVRINESSVGEIEVGCELKNGDGKEIRIINYSACYTFKLMKYLHLVPDCKISKVCNRRG